MIFWKLCYKISPFWAFFLEFFGLGNNLTLQDHHYTRAITLILGIERNEKNHFSMGLFLQDLQEFLRISCAARQESCKISYSCRKHYSCPLFGTQDLTITQASFIITYYICNFQVIKNELGVLLHRRLLSLLLIFDGFYFSSVQQR